MYPAAKDRTWIVLADSSRARIFLADQKLTNCRLLREFQHPESRLKGRELISGGGDRTSGDAMGIGAGRSATDPLTDPREVEVQRFARELASELDHGRTHNAVDELIIAAPPHFLGRLRDAMNRNLIDMIRSDIPKNLTRLEDAKVLEKIRSEILEPGRG